MLPWLGISEATNLMCDTLDGHPQSRLDDLLPWAYPTIPGLKTAA